MRRGVKAKLKVYAVDMAMLFLAFQVTAVTRGSTKETTGHPVTPILYVESEKENADPDELLPIEETRAEDRQHSLIKSLDWDSEDAEVLLKIAMAEAEGESVEGKALVMLVVLNRVWSEGFPNSIPEVVFQKGQFTPTNEGGRYWSTEPDAGCYEAYRMILQGWDESHGALYFSVTGSCPWMDSNTEYLFTVGNHSFYK